MQVLDARTARTDDGRTRCYAAPAFVRLGGTWRAIDDVLSVTRDRGTYRVQVGDDWIAFAPRVRPAGQLRRSIVGKRRFGDVIDATAKPDTAEYDVSYSRGVERIAAGWRFTGIADADLGVFLTDWLTRFGAARVVIADDRATLDLTDVQADRRGEINLDPATVAPTANIYFYGYHLGEYAPADAWAGCRNGSNVQNGAIFDDGRCMAMTYAGYFESCEMRRQCLNFDTSAFPAAGKVCTLVLTEINPGQVDEGDDFGVARVDPPVALVDGLADWQAINAAADAGHSGSGAVCTHAGGSTWQSPDLIAAGQYAQAPDLQLAVLAAHDLANQPLTVQMSKGRQYDPATAYLEFTDAPLAAPRPGRPLAAGCRGGLGGPTP